MLVLANGAYKSGSTWLAAILWQIVGDAEPVPEAYRNRGARKGWLAERKIRPFLESGLHLERNYRSKGHIQSTRHRDLLLSHEGVVVFDITRDLRDAVVSHYYHFRRQKGMDWDFRTYYRRVGRYKAHQIVRYHEVWDVPSPQVYVSSFERLKTDFRAEVRRLAAVLGKELDDEAIEAIRQKTSLSSLARQWGQDSRPPEERHFRKGGTGDWRDHFDEESLADIAAIERGELGTLDRLAYHSLITVRARLVVEVGEVVRPLLARPTH